MNKYLQLFKNLLVSDLVKVSSWSAISTFVKIVTSLVSVKVAAIIIGPEGVALVSQFGNGISYFSMLSTAGIGTGIVQMISKHNDNRDYQSEIISTSSILTIGLSLFISLFTLIFYTKISYYIFNNNKYDTIVIIFGLTIILGSINSLLLNVVNGYKEYKKFIIINVLTSVISLFFALALVLTLKLEGALYNVFLSQCVIVLITIYLLRKEKWMSFIVSPKKINNGILKNLLGFSLMTIISLFLIPTTQILIRGFIVGKASLNEAGLWDSMNRISAMTLLIITTSLSTYYLPRLSEIKNESELRLEVLKTMKLVIPALSVLLIVVYYMRFFIINLLFSNKFYGMENLFFYQLLGDFFKIAAWLIGFTLLSKGLSKIYIIIEVLFSLLLVALSYYLIDLYGIIGSTVAYFANYFILFILFTFYFFVQTNHKLVL